MNENDYAGICAENLVQEIIKRDSEIARMRPVFNAAMRWSKDPNTGTGYESEMQLTRACARAKRKAKEK